MSIEKSKLENEELKNISGGTCYSKGTYQSLGFKKIWSVYSQWTDHPVIVTVGNCCSHWVDGGKVVRQHTCNGCMYMQPKGIKMYCGIRSEENPTGEERFEPF